MFVKFFFLILFQALCSSPAFAVTGSITDPGFSSDRELKQSLFGPVRGAVKARFSRDLRRGHWKNFLSPDWQNSLFDSLFLKTDLSLSYPLSEGPPFFTKSSFFNKASVFLTLAYRRPVYDPPESVKWHCFSSYVCFGETSLGLSGPLPQKSRLKSGYSVYVSLPTARKSFDQKKWIGFGSSLSANYQLFSRGDFQVSGISSHYFDTAVYGDEHANEQGSRSNDMFSVFNQGGLRFSLSGKPFIPRVLIYASHLLALDYQKDWFQALSLGCSAVWPAGDRLRLVAGLSWGGAIFRHQYTAKAKDVDPFNPDETYLSGGFSYSF